MTDERIRIEYWPISPMATVDDRQGEVASEVDDLAAERAVVGRPRS